MTHASLLFYNTNPQVSDTLYRNLLPSDEQYKEQKERWNDLAEYLKEKLKNETGLPISSWLQGSYKFETQIRPTSKFEEFDIDLGIYFGVDQKPTADQHSPINLKKLIQKYLKIYAKELQDDSVKVLEPPKERCNRIIFPGSFHIDIPCYYEIAGTHKLGLATETHGWEGSDPIAFYEWFQNSFDETERSVARRMIRYMKCWACITFKKEKKDGRPSSVLITVLVAQALKSLPKSIFDFYDDEILGAILSKILEKLQLSYRVNNPVNESECLTDRIESFGIFLENLKIFNRIAAEALTCPNAITASLKWQEAFQYFFPIPEETDIKSINNSLALYRFDPIIKVTAISKDNTNLNYSGINKIDPIPKNCSITFEITNTSQIPAGSIIQWIVRNRGKDSDDINDLGHNAGSTTVATENSAYKGTHYMDCLITFNKQVLAFKRIAVTITGAYAPRRNPPKPIWTKKF